MPQTEVKAHFTVEQQKVISEWGVGQAVLAGAGCGKTTTMVGKCVELIQKKSDARFAAVSFTEKSATDLRRKLAQKLPTRDRGSVLQGHWVTTIHGLCAKILKEYPEFAGLDGEEAVLSQQEQNLLWEQSVERLWFEEVSDTVLLALERFLETEKRSGLVVLLRRVRELSSLGVIESLLDPKQGQMEQDLGLLSSFVMLHYERLKKRRGVLDFSDLEKYALLALDHEAVRRSYQKRFDLVLVDEFQDTNPLQAQIISKFVKPDFSNLCIVGDPKQSIYRFRDADVSLFDEFVKKLPRTYHLTQNFRSQSKILTFVNQVCSPLFNASNLLYEDLKPSQTVGAKLTESEKPFNPVEKWIVKTPEELAHFLKSEQAAGTHLGDMALLLRKVRASGEKWLTALQKSGIPLAIGSGGQFWEDPRIQELVSFLKAWDNPRNQLSAAIFLRSPWVGISDLVLDQWSKTGEPLLDLFLKSDHVLAQSLRIQKNQELRPGEVLWSLMGDARVEEELGVQLLGLWHRCEEYSSSRLSFSQVVKELSRAVDERRREADLPPPRQSGVLTVLTVHGSKGLEFPHVILVDFDDKPKITRAPQLFWDRAKGAYLGKRDEEGTREKESPLENEFRAWEMALEISEQKRVFYVALTRAKERLALVFLNPEKETDKKPVKELKPEEILLKDFWRGWIDQSKVDIPVRDGSLIGEFFPVETPQIKKLSQLRYQNPVTLIKTRTTVTEWNLFWKCPRSYEWTLVRKPDLLDEQKDLKEYSVQIDLKELGTRVHECLEHLNEEGLKQIEQEVGSQFFKAAPVIDWMRESVLMKPTQGDYESWVELPFEVRLAQKSSAPQTIVGAMDRLVAQKTDAGICYTVVDYKITAKPKTDEELVSAYQFQMELYAEAVRCFDPDAREVKVVLVNISPFGVREILVPLFRSGQFLVEFEKSAVVLQAILNGGKGDPKPGSFCKMCDFRSQCDAAKL